MLHLATYDWFQAFCESFLCKIHTSYGSAKVFSLESLLLYGNLFEHTCIDNMDFITALHVGSPSLAANLCKHVEQTMRFMCIKFCGLVVCTE